MCNIVITGINWTCWRKSCSTVKTNGFDVNDDNAAVIVITPPSQHCHEPDDDMIGFDAFREAVNKSVCDDPSRPIKRAYDATAATVARGGTLRINRGSISEFHTMSVSRAKRENVPRIPRHLNDVWNVGKNLE